MMTRTPEQSRTMMSAIRDLADQMRQTACTEGQPCKCQWVDPDGYVMAFSKDGYSSDLQKSYRSWMVYPANGRPFRVVARGSVCRVGTPYCDVHRELWDSAMKRDEGAVKALEVQS